MSQKKSVTYVLLIGQLIINVPIAIIMVGIPIIIWFIFDEDWLLTIGIGVTIGFFLSLAWWRFTTNLWCNWAFKHTDKKDWPSLETGAINSGLIWSEGHYLEKKEKKEKTTKTQRQKNETIKKKNEEPSLKA